MVAQGLEALDSARQLYQRAEFATLRLSFLRTLFTTLLRRSHSLLQDEIIVAIHSIVSVVRCDVQSSNTHIRVPALFVDPGYTISRILMLAMMWSGF